MTVSDDFRRAMRCAASSVYLVTTEHDGARGGLTATAVASLSFAPLSMLVCVNREATCYPLLSKGNGFGLSLLGSSDAGLAGLFGTPGTDKERFDQGEWALMDGQPVLKTALAGISLRKTAEHPAGSHAVFFGDVLAVAINDREDGLIYGAGRFGRFQADD